MAAHFNYREAFIRLGNFGKKCDEPADAGDTGWEDLGTSGIGPDVLREIYDRYLERSPEITERDRPAVGCNLVFACTDYLEAGLFTIDDINRCLDGGGVKDRIIEVYGIPPEHSGGDWSFHRAGTTSIILKLEKDPDHKLALKLIKPQFFKYQKIRGSTQNYRTKMLSLDTRYTPKVHHSDDYVIIMDFVEGLTLREYVNRFVRPRLRMNIVEQHHVDNMLTLVASICRALNYIHTRPEGRIEHLDLSPDNIIVKLSCEQNKTVGSCVLIDFGHNYLLTERIGSVPAVSRARVYMAPELGNSFGKGGDYRSDLYSLGMILLDMISPDELGERNHVRNIEKAWSNFPDFASVVERLTSEEPAQRLSGNDPDTIYMTIEASLRARVTVYFKTRSLVNAETVLTDYVDWKLAGAKALKARYNAVRDLDKSLTENMYHSYDLRRERSLFKWSFATYWSNIIIFALALIASLDFWIRLGTTLYHAVSQKNPVWASIRPPIDLAGIMVGVSFMVVASAYYINIFSTIAPPIGAGAARESIVANRWMRVNSFIYALPIITAIFNPAWWPFCSAAGVFFVTMNNRACYRLIGKLLDGDSLRPDAREYYQRFLKDYKGWVTLMTAYWLVLLLVGFLLRMGWAKDEWIYALLVAFVINIVKMLVHNCVKTAPLVRAVVTRACDHIGRAASSGT